MLPYQQQPIQETIYYQDQSPIFISSLRVIINNQTFLTRNIVSVSIYTLGPNYLFEILSFFAGLILSGVGFANFVRDENNPWVPLYFGIMLIGLAIFLFKSKKVRYALAIDTGNGPFPAFISPNQEYITTLVNVINSILLSRS